MITLSLAALALVGGVPQAPSMGDPDDDRRHRSRRQRPLAGDEVG